MSNVWKRWTIALTLALFTSLVAAPLALANVTAAPALVGPKKHYLALGDSIAFGYQPDLDFGHGYSYYFGKDLQSKGGKYRINMSCPGETSTTMIEGECRYPFLRKFPYLGAQLDAAISYISIFKGQVSPVTLTIGANDVLPLIDPETCTINTGAYETALATLDHNLSTIILPQLQQALTINGVVTGDIILLNYYNPYQNLCPESIPFTNTFNQHLAQAADGFATVVDIYGAYGGDTAPNPNTCTYTWICSNHKDVHATDNGHRVIANTIEAATYWQ